MNILNKKIIFQSRSNLTNARFIIYQFLGLGILIYLFTNLNENPILIGLVICFLLFFILLNSRGRIIVYEDGFSIIYKRLIPQLSTKRFFKYEDIGLITAELPLTEENHIITELLPPIFSFVSIWNTITITYTDGKLVKLKSKIYEKEFNGAFDVIRRHYFQNIKILK